MNRAGSLFAHEPRQHKTSLLQMKLQIMNVCKRKSHMKINELGKKSMSARKSAANPSNYDEAAISYREGRLDYAPYLIERAAKTAGLGADSTVLDLGCGPGTIANEIAQFCGHVLAVDISEAMLDIGRQYAPENVTYIQGSSDDMSFIDTPLQLVTFGRSFHWMDREKTLEILDEHVAPGGCLAFLYVTPFKGNTPSHQWWNAVRRMANTLEIPDIEEADPLEKKAERQEIILAKSAFSKVTFSGSLEIHDWTFGNLVAWVRSRYRTGMTNSDTLEKDIRRHLRKILAPYGPGPWRTYNHHRMVIAQRPG